MARYLGVDGGGSKTAFALIDDTGRVLARALAATSYYFSTATHPGAPPGDSLGVVERAVTQGISDICGQANIAPGEIDWAFFGLPGYGEASHDIAALDALPARALGHYRYSCDNDMVCGWAGSLAGADGINVISGTGSMTYGERRGVGHRVGGWGELFGDEGSAYWVAAQGLGAFSRMSDGRSPRGPLYPLLKARLEIANDLDAVSLIIDTWGGARGSIAALATTICQAAHAGDQSCARILDEAVGELVALVETTRTLTGFADGEIVPVSYSGGMFTDEGYVQRFLAALAALPATYEVRRPVLDPAVGAALYAAAKSANPLNDQAIARLAGTVSEEMSPR